MNRKFFKKICSFSQNLLNEFHENIYWPEETPSWTSGACILAADANHQLTPGADLFIKQQFKPELGKR